jgi:Glycosyltransferase family 87
VSTFALSALARRRIGVARWVWWSELNPALLLALVGIEVAALVALLPDTLSIWWQGKPSPDFQLLLNAARDLKPNGLYSPGLSLLLYPLTVLDEANAYRVYAGLGALAVAAIAYLAQCGIRPLEARVAVALGIISIPQMHWALRFGHLTPFLALAALGGFLLLRRRPYLAGLCFALLVLKPQYAPMPALYLLWTRNGRALAGLLGGALVLETAGFAAAGLGEIGPYVSGLLDMGSDSRDNLAAIQQSWQYAWPGFLKSAGLEANPLLVADALALSLAAVVLVWLRGSVSTAMAAAALGMLLVAPYANFYDWGLLVVAGVLLLRAEIRWKSLLPVVAVVLYVALIATQAATPWPISGLEINVVQTGDQLSLAVGDIGTRGLYWVTPAALAAVCFLAVAAQRTGRSSATLHAREDAPDPGRVA